MADNENIRHTKKEVIAEIRNRLEKNPNVGLYEFVGSMLQSKGIDVDINNLSDIREKAKQLNAKDKKEIAIALAEYKKDYDKAIENFDKSVHKDITKLPRKAVATIAKGVGMGAGVAGVVNTVMPGLFSTGLGYLAGLGVDLSTLTKSGLVVTGMFMPPELSKGAILALGAVTGGITYSAGKLVVTGIKKLSSNLKSQNREER